MSSPFHASIHCRLQTNITKAAEKLLNDAGGKTIRRQRKQAYHKEHVKVRGITARCMRSFFFTRKTVNVSIQRLHMKEWKKHRPYFFYLLLILDTDFSCVCLVCVSCVCLVCVSRVCLVCVSPVCFSCVFLVCVLLFEIFWCVQCCFCFVSVVNCSSKTLKNA